MTAGKNNWDSTRSDAELVSIYRQSGDLEVLGVLFDRYIPLVYGLCLKYLKDEDESKDAVMQIFEQLIDKLRVHQVENFRAWLYTVTRNYCLMHLRVQAKQDFVNIEDNIVETGPVFHPDSGNEDEEKLKCMEACIEKLPGEQRICIDLFYLKQKCYREVAALTGYELNKVKSYIQNGKRNLKICMEKNCGDKQH